MTVLTGQTPPTPLCGGLETLSDCLHGGVVTFLKASIEAVALAASDGPPCPNPRTPLVLAGVPAGMFGASCLFEKIVILPRRKDLGYLVGSASWTVEVWNTHGNSGTSLSAVNVSGTGGAVVTGPASMVYWPGQCQTYTVAMPSAGVATIAEMITFVIDGEAGTDHTITGTRLKVFAAPCDWSEPFQETLSWKSRILVSRTGVEQRAALRQRPRYTLSFRVVSLDVPNTIELEGLLHAFQPDILGVPMWPEYAYLAGPATAGDKTLQIATADRPAFAEGGYCMLWSSMQRWEAVGIASISSASIAIDTPLARSWPAGTKVVPLRLGRLPDSQTLGRPTNWLTSGAFTFNCVIT